MARQGALIAAVAVLAGAAGWGLRGLADGDGSPPAIAPASGAAAQATPEVSNEQASAERARERRSADRRRRPDVEQEPTDPVGRTLVALGLTRAEALARLPELLEDARKAADDRRIEALLVLAASSARGRHLQLVLDAMLSDDIAFEFAHRDDVFERLLIDRAGPEVGAAAETWLRREIDRGETSSAFIGGYARLIGASGTPEGIAFLEQLLASKNGGLRGVGAVGLLVTGDPAVPEPVASALDIGEGEFSRFVKAAGDGGVEALRGAVMGNGVRTRSREAIAAVIGKSGSAADVDALLRLAESGRRRAALHGLMRLPESGVDAHTLERAREHVLETVRDPEAGNARRTAFYVLEYNAAFQTAAAEAALIDVLDREPDEYIQSTARDALREVRKQLRRTAAAENE